MENFSSNLINSAIDIVVVEQEDGSCKSSSFFVRFGIFFPNNQVVDIEINENPVTNEQLVMKLDESGNAFFLINNEKTITLSSDQIKMLNLNHGLNTITYSVTTALEGTNRIYSKIFLWKHDDKIIVSDIDGTITRSDILGHVLYIINIDWTHSNVAKLFTVITNNQYRVMYLSARPIGMSQMTRNLLMNINQDEFRLPDGPLLLNPSSIVRSFITEVIERNPEEFKIKCLKEIKSLFPKLHNPFYAGFGNKTNDAAAYKEIEIEDSRIFTVNYEGIIKNEKSNTFQSSYSNLCNSVSTIFEPFMAQDSDTDKTRM